MRDHIEREGWTEVAMFVEPGQTGRRDDRPELTKLRDRLAEFDVVVVPSIDRLGRGYTFLTALKGEMDDAGVRLVTLNPLVDYGSSIGLMLWANLTAMAQIESESIGARVSAVTAANAAEGKFPGGRFPPFGYRREPIPGTRRSRLVPVPEEVAVVLRIYTEALAGRTQRDIAVDLKREGVRTAQGAMLHRANIGRILRAPVYVGRVEVKGEVYGGKHEGIVPLDVWERVQAQRAGLASTKGKGRGRPTNAPFLFTTGRLRCGTCGSAMSPRSYKHGGSYECRGGHDWGKDHCGQPPVPRALIDAAALRYSSTPVWTWKPRAPP